MLTLLPSIHIHPLFVRRHAMVVVVVLELAVHTVRLPSYHPPPDLERPPSRPPHLQYKSMAYLQIQAAMANMVTITPLLEKPPLLRHPMASKHQLIPPPMSTPIPLRLPAAPLSTTDLSIGALTSHLTFKTRSRLNPLHPT